MPIMIWLAAIIEAAIQNFLDMGILLMIQFINASIGYYEITKVCSMYVVCHMSYNFNTAAAADVDADTAYAPLMMLPSRFVLLLLVIPHHSPHHLSYINLSSPTSPIILSQPHHLSYTYIGRRRRGRPQEVAETRRYGEERRSLRQHRRNLGGPWGPGAAGLWLCHPRRLPRQRGRDRGKAYFIKYISCFLSFVLIYFILFILYITFYITF
jgi:hypothetical protein